MSRGKISGVISTAALLVLATACAETHEVHVIPCEAGEGRTCTPENFCETGVWRCWSDGEEVCVSTGLLPEGAPCDVGLACDDVGSCGVCTPGVTCDLGEPCVRGEIDCAPGVPTCLAAEDYPVRTPCGVDDICDGMGVCVEG